MPGVTVSKVAFAAMKAFTPQESTAPQIPLQEPQLWPVEPRFWLVPCSKASTPQDKTEPLTPQFLSFLEDLPTFSDLSAYFRNDGEAVKDKDGEPVLKDKACDVAVIKAGGARRAEAPEELKDEDTIVALRMALRIALRSARKTRAPLGHR